MYLFIYFMSYFVHVPPTSQIIMLLALFAESLDICRKNIKIAYSFVRNLVPSILLSPHGRQNTIYWKVKTLGYFFFTILYFLTILLFNA
jgi:hypothetical protein